MGPLPSGNPAFAEQTKCKVGVSRTNPLVVEWPAADRAALEARIRKGTVVVAYEACSVVVLPRCKLGAKYAYSSVSEKTDAIAIRNADELYAKLPVGAVGLEAQLARAGQLTVETHLVGMFESERLDISPQDLSGSCEGATHVITAAQVGAYEFYAGKSQSVGGAAAVGAAGVGGRHESARETLSRDGDKAACKEAQRGDVEPPHNCGALIRLELSPLRNHQQGPAPAGAPSCPASTVLAANNTCIPERRSSDPALLRLAGIVDSARGALATDDLAAARRHADAALASFAKSRGEPGSLAADYAAEAAFIRAQVAAAGLTPPPKPMATRELEDWTKATAARFSDANDAYLEVAKFERLGWQYAAAFGRAALCESFGNLLVAVSPPSEFAGDQEMEGVFADAMFDKADPFFECAHDRYRAMHERAKQQNFDSDWVRRAARRVDPLGD